MKRHHRLWRLAILAISILTGIAAHAHDIPDDVRVQLYLKPDGDRLTLLARVPLKAMRDVDVPQRADGMLDFDRVDAALRDAVALWLADEIELFERGVRLPRPRLVDARVALASDRSFASFDQALAGFAAPRLSNDTTLYWSQGLLDVRLETAISAADAPLAIHPHLERLGLRVTTVVRYLPAVGVVRAFELHGDPGVVDLDPSWRQAAWRFVVAGMRHIVEGVDHLLFLVLLVLPHRRLAPLAAMVTAFTVAHSITLIATALGYAPRGLWFAPAIEVLIAASIVVMAIEDAVSSRVNLTRRWMLTLAFGLVHGFGFALGLAELTQFAGEHLIGALVSFNIGVELAIVGLIALVLRIPWLATRAATIVIALLAGHTAWHWLTERWEKLTRFSWPTWDAAAAAELIRWGMGLAVLFAAAWWIEDASRRRARK